MTKDLHRLSLVFLLTIVGLMVKAQNIQELCLFNTDFTEWEKVNNSSSEQTVEKKTAFTKENLTFTLLNNEVNPTGTNAKFNEGTVGYMMAAKDPNTYVITSPLSSIRSMFWF